MAADENILREFLVGLGFKIDESGLKKFIGVTEGASAAVFALGAAAVAAGAAIETYVSKLSESGEDIYWMSRRIHASVGAIEGYAYAIAQAGGTADAAKGSLEGLASFLRSNPAGESFLNRLGIQTRDAKGQILDLVDIMDNVGKKLRSQPYWRQKVVAGVLGVDESTLQAMDRGIEKQQKAYAALYGKSGVDPQKAAAASREYQQSLRELDAQFHVLGQAILVDFMPGASAFLNWMKDATKWAIKLAGALQSWDKLSAFASKSTAAPRKFLDRFYDAKGKPIDWSLSSLFGGPSPTGSRKGSARPTMSSAEAWAMKFLESAGKSPIDAAGLVANLSWESSGLNPAKVGDHGKAYGIGQWWPDRQAAFRKWAGHDIHGSSLAEQLRFVLYELTSGGEQFAGRMMAQARSAYQSGALTSHFYERPKADAWNMDHRGRMAERIFAAAQLANSSLSSTPLARKTVVTLNQKTDIHVSGNGATDTANQTAQAQDRVNGRLLRNTKAAVQ